MDNRELQIPCNHKFKVTKEKQWDGQNVWLYDISCAHCDYDDFFVLASNRNKLDAIAYSLDGKPDRWDKINAKIIRVGPLVGQ